MATGESTVTQSTVRGFICCHPDCRTTIGNGITKCELPLVHTETDAEFGPHKPYAYEWGVTDYCRPIRDKVLTHALHGPRGNRVWRFTHDGEWE